VAKPNNPIPYPCLRAGEKKNIKVLLAALAQPNFKKIFFETCPPREGAGGFLWTEDSPSCMIVKHIRIS
jgi:hypothetical protein